MPIYEYTCCKCKSDFELLIRGQEQAVCPECNSLNVEKQLSVPAAHSITSNSLPLCNQPMRANSCGLPKCGQGGCQFPE